MTTKKEAQEWINENEDRIYLGHGSADRHEIYLEKMRKIVNG